jgi:hypothetical protein
MVANNAMVFFMGWVVRASGKGRFGVGRIAGGVPLSGLRRRGSASFEQRLQQAFRLE